MNRHNILGFSLMELLIAIAIIGILAAVAIPTYQKYTRKAYYSEVVSATNPYKIAVVECYHTYGMLNECNAGSYGIPKPITSTTGLIASISVEKGVISVVPIEKHGIVANDNYVLTPILVNSHLTWVSSGGGVVAGYAR